MHTEERWKYLFMVLCYLRAFGLVRCAIILSCLLPSAEFPRSSSIPTPNYILPTEAGRNLATLTRRAERDEALQDLCLCPKKGYEVDYAINHWGTSLLVSLRPIFQAIPDRVFEYETSTTIQGQKLSIIATWLYPDCRPFGTLY